MVVLNPGLEAVGLRRDDAGQWRVSHAAWYPDAGLCPPGTGLRLDEPLPAVTATLTTAGVSVTVQGSPEGPFTSSVPTGFAATVRARGGLLFAVTHAIDPSRITTLADLQPVVQGDRTLVGWATLAR